MYDYDQNLYRKWKDVTTGQEKSNIYSIIKNDFLAIRFDLSGFGVSDGEQYEFQFQKAAGDVDSVIRYARKIYPNKRINIIAHSLGTFIVSLLSP